LPILGWQQNYFLYRKRTHYHFLYHTVRDIFELATLSRLLCTTRRHPIFHCRIRYEGCFKLFLRMQT